MNFPQKSSEHVFQKTIVENRLVGKGDKIIVALSGGADSVCLFSLFFQFKDKFGIDLMACHYNHRLRGEESDRDEAFVKKFCGERGIEVLFGSAPSKNLFKNEEEARDARYDFFEKILKDNRGAKIAIAHNANDLFETLLLRLVRGSGIKGLRAIPLCRENFIRPLLYLSRAQIENYLKETNTNYISDKTNYSLKHARNFVRLKVIPLLLKLNPQLIETSRENILSLDEDYNYLEKESFLAYNEVVGSEASDCIEFNRKDWLALHPAMRKGVLRIAIEKLASLEDINLKHIREIEGIALKGEGGKHKLLPHSLRAEMHSGKIIIRKV